MMKGAYRRHKTKFKVAGALAAGAAGALGGLTLASPKLRAQALVGALRAYSRGKALGGAGLARMRAGKSRMGGWLSRLRNFRKRPNITGQYT